MSPWKPLWTHPCPTYLTHLERPQVQLNCHHDDEIWQELVIVHVNYKVWVGISQSHLGVNPTKHHWQWVQGQNHSNLLGLVNAPKPTFVAPKLVHFSMIPKARATQ